MLRIGSGLDSINFGAPAEMENPSWDALTGKPAVLVDIGDGEDIVYPGKITGEFQGDFTIESQSLTGGSRNLASDSTSNDLDNGDDPLIYVSCAGSCTITGFVAVRPGFRRLIIGLQAGTLTLSHDTGSAAANRLFCPGNANLVLGHGAGAELIETENGSGWDVLPLMLDT